MGLGFEVWVIISEQRKVVRRGEAHAALGHQVSKEREGVAMAEVNAFRLFR